MHCHGFIYIWMSRFLFLCTPLSSLKCAAQAIQGKIIFHAGIRRVPKDSQEIKQERRRGSRAFPPKFPQPLLNTWRD